MDKQTVKIYQGIGAATVKTYGKRSMPAFIKLSKGRVVRAILESHEQDGKQPVLLSGQSQAEFGLLKDMRNKTVYLADFCDYVELCRAHDTGPDCICISNYVKREKKTTATGRVPKEINKTIGANGGVDVRLTAGVATGLQHYGLDPNLNAMRHDGLVSQKIHIITTGSFFSVM